MATICLEKEVAETEVKEVAEGEQVCGVLQKDFWFSLRAG